ASSTFIPGQTITPRKIENAGARYFVIIGTITLSSFWRRLAEKMFTSQLILIVSMRAGRRRIGRRAASQLQILNGRLGNCASRRRLLEAIFVAPIQRQITRVSN